MKECIPKIVDIVNGKIFSITLEGIGNFRKEVLFANILPGEALSQISLIAGEKLLTIHWNISYTLL